MMRSERLSPARLARSLVAILLLTLVQVVGTPVLAPQIAASSASAADANDFPSGLGTVYQFLAESYTSGSTTWPEARGGTSATISASALKVTNTAGTLGASKSVVAVQGTTAATLTFPTTIGPGTSSSYTLLYVARYAPASGSAYQAGNYCDTVTHQTSGGKSRIFTSVSGNWLSGFWACAPGVAYHEGWVTQSSSAVSELSGNNGNNWLLASDCGYTSASTAACKGRFRAFGTDRTSVASLSTAVHQVMVNGGAYSELSDFQIAEVISYPTILQDSDLVKVETYLSRKYGINLSASSATKLGAHRSSIGTNLNEALATQPQIAIQDANGQTVTTDNSTIITASVTGTNGKLIGTTTATAIQGVATFDSLGVDGVPGNSYTITYTSNTALAATSESRTFTRGGGSDTDTALSLNGTSQYANLSGSTILPSAASSPFTFQAWVNPTATGANDSIFSQGTGSSRFYIKRSSGNLYWNRDGWTGAGDQNCGAFPTGSWTHIALTWNGSNTANCYVNGVLTLTTTVTSITGSIGAPAVIGQYSAIVGDSTSYFAGQIDELRMWNSVRTTTQIATDMHSYGSVADPNLIAYYDFNESSGSTLFNRKVGATSASDFPIIGPPSRVDVKTVDTTTLSAYTIVKFPRTYLTSIGGWKTPSGVRDASAVVVAGGGGGGSRAGGGGGAGGYVYSAKISLTVGKVETVTVGQGGFGARFTTELRPNQGYDGQDSKFSGTVSALGGGGGGGAGGDNTTRAGRNGGSGGGASGDLSTVNASAPIGNGNQNSTYSMGLGSNGGSGRNGDYWPGGGGGGAISSGGTSVSTTSKAGNGGSGTLDPVGGSGKCLAAGGGGGTSSAGSSVGAGDAGICAGGTTTATAGTVGSLVPGSADPNSGSGGGGSGWSGSADVAGGNGASGVVIIRWITAAKPIFTQPTNDTTTAGLVDTITVSSNPLTPLTRNYLWQVSTDTGTTWVNASTGSGMTSNIYTTPILETTTSGNRYQYRVVVTDSDTAGLSIIDTSTAVFIIINPRITYSGSYTVQKYGSTHQDTFTVLNGTGNKSLAYSPNNRSGITWSSPVANTAVLTIATTLFVGTYFETITATDTKGAQTTLGISIIVTKADTITVTSIAKSDTYTGSALSFTPTFTISGLKNSDTVTAGAMNWNYNGLENSGNLYAIQSTKPLNAGSYVITPVPPSSLTDSYTAVTIVTSALTVNRATRTLSATAPASPLKYGDTKTVSSTLSAGSGDGTLSYSTSTTDSCTVSSTIVQAIKSSGTCSFTAQITRGNNYETATASAVTTTLTKADTLTVTVDAMAPLTYTGAQIGITPTVTVTGLKLTNSVGATPATIKYSSSGGAGVCASGGACAVGDTGPGGGIVFYDAGSQQSWGRYLEIAKSGWNGAGETTARWCSTALAATAVNVITDGIGQGLANSTTIANACGEGAAYMSRNYNGGGKTNWYLPTPAEFGLMYTNRSVIDLSASLILWLSTEPNDANRNWVGVVGALSSAGTGGNNKLDILTFRPIRAFAAGDTSQNFIVTKPTDADTYTVRASALTLLSGSLNDYQGISYTDATLRINRAIQSQLYLAEYGAFFGTPYQVIVFGGSGTGASKVTTISGTASGCAVSGDTLTTTSVGTCQVTAVKAQDKNYETATVTIYVYFLQYVIQQPTPPTSSGPGIALSGATAVTLDPNQAPTISGISSSSGQVGTSVTITGAGFTASALQSVKFWRNVIASIQGTPTNTQIVVLVPAGATTGKITVTTLNGVGITEGSFTVLP